MNNYSAYVVTYRYLTGKCGLNSRSLFVPLQVAVSARNEDDAKRIAYHKLFMHEEQDRAEATSPNEPWRFYDDLMSVLEVPEGGCLEL